jgi:hypothetical protein
MDATVSCAVFLNKTGVVGNLLVRGDVTHPTSSVAFRKLAFIQIFKDEA